MESAAGGHDFLLALATVLCVAAVTTVLFQRLRQPVVLGYLIAGLIIGPHVPVPLVADATIVHTLSELGVVLLMYSLGLEFRLSKLLEVGPTAGLTAIIESSAMLWLGFVVGRLFGWTLLESFFTGAIVAISSTTIIAKAFEEHPVDSRVRTLVLGVLVVEDLIAVVLMATLTALATGEALSLGALAATAGRLLAFLAAVLGVGLLTVPRGIRLVLRLRRPETTLIAAVGLSFAVALLARAFGYSVALGAFIAGTLTAESGEGRAIAQHVAPVRDVFAAVFFVSVGMLLDPAVIFREAPALLALVGVVIVGKMLGVSLGAFLTGNGIRVAVAAGMSLAQIGEFSFIIAGLGRSLSATGAFLAPLAVAVSAVTTLSTPWLIRASGPAAAYVDRRLPRPLQTFATLYASWLEQLQQGAHGGGLTSALRRRALALAVDAVLLALLIIGTAMVLRRSEDDVARFLGVATPVAAAGVVTIAVLIGLPFVVGIARTARSLGAQLAEVALPHHETQTLDRAAAPRRALTVTLQLAMVLLVGVPLLAVTQPFLPSVGAVPILGALVAALAVAFWRSATNLEGHLRAGAEMLLQVLSSSQRRSEPLPLGELQEVRRLLPGLGDPTPLRLGPSSPALGKSLAELNLRGLTGATVIAITRAEDGVLIPAATERLREDDVLTLVGTHEAVAAAAAVLVGR